MKRARTTRDTLTGGTGDVKPQLLNLSTGLAGGVDDYVVFQAALPVPRFGTMKTKATIFELLSVDWYLAPQNMLDATQNVQSAFLSTVVTRSNGDTVTVGSITADIDDPRNFAFAYRVQHFTTSGGSDTTYPIHLDLTDNAGNGILVATDKLVITGASLTPATAGSYIAKIAYRLTNVGITEYVGIVQSQQS